MKTYKKKQTKTFRRDCCDKYNHKPIDKAISFIVKLKYLKQDRGSMTKKEIKLKLEDIDSAYLIEELYLRGVSIKDVFGRYYEFELSADARTMDVDDANYAGLTKPGKIEEEPF